MFPKDIVDKLEAIDIDMSIVDKIMKFEQWKNANGEENTPAAIEKFAEFLKGE